MFPPHHHDKEHNCTLPVKLLPSSQNVTGIESIIKKEPGEELDSRQTLRLPNPKNGLRRPRSSKMVLIILLSRVRLSSPYESPNIIVQGSPIIKGDEISF